MYYDKYNVNVVLLDDAGGVPGSVWHNADDSYTIFIDAKLCAEHQRKVFQHELGHICEGDFEKENTQIIGGNMHAKF